MIAVKIKKDKKRMVQAVFLNTSQANDTAQLVPFFDPASNGLGLVLISEL